MKKITAILGVLLASVALASDVYSRTITSTGTATTPVRLQSGNWLVVCDASAKMNQGPTSSVTVSSSVYSVWLEAAEKWPFTVGTGGAYVTLISVSGTANCNFSRVLP